MSTEHNKAVVIRLFHAVNTKDLDKIDRIVDETYAQDFIHHDPGLPPYPDGEPGPVAAKKFLHQALLNSPDLRVTLDDMVADGDKVVFRYTIHETDGNTGKPITTLAISIVRCVGGKFSEEWEIGAPGEW